MPIKSLRPSAPPSREAPNLSALTARTAEDAPAYLIEPWASRPRGKESLTAVGAATEEALDAC